MKLVLSFLIFFISFPVFATTLVSSEQTDVDVQFLMQTLSSNDKKKIVKALNEMFEKKTYINVSVRQIDGTVTNLSTENRKEISKVLDVLRGLPDMDRIHVSFDRRSSAGSFFIRNGRFQSECDYRMRASNKDRTPKFYKFECEGTAF